MKMDIPKWFLLVMVLLMNIAQGLLLTHAFKDASPGFITANVIVFVVMNMFAFIGQPIVPSKTLTLADTVPDKTEDKNHDAF